MRLVGVVINRDESDAEAQTHLAAFRQRIRELGWFEGRNIQLVDRWTLGSANRSQTIAAELVRMKPDAANSRSWHSMPRSAPLSWPTPKRLRPRP
jgi:hypothetical protein